MNRHELNEYALNSLENLKEHGLFEELEIIEDQIKNHKDKSDIEFYQGIQDQVNYIYGEVSNTLGELSAELESYIANRKLMVSVEYSNDKKFTIKDEEIKLNSTMISAVRISSLIKSEVSDLYKVVLLLESKVDRIKNSLQTSRNHSYVNKTINYERKEN